MFHDNIKSIFSSAVQSIVSKISDFAVRSGKDFTRRKKFPADKLLAFLAAEGSSSTKNECFSMFRRLQAGVSKNFSYIRRSFRSEKDSADSSSDSGICRNGY